MSDFIDIIRDIRGTTGEEPRLDEDNVLINSTESGLYGKIVSLNARSEDAERTTKNIKSSLWGTDATNGSPGTVLDNITTKNDNVNTKSGIIDTQFDTIAGTTGDGLTNGLYFDIVSREDSMSKHYVAIDNIGYDLAGKDIQGVDYADNTGSKVATVSADLELGDDSNIVLIGEDLHKADNESILKLTTEHFPTLNAITSSVNLPNIIAVGEDLTNANTIGTINNNLPMINRLDIAIQDSSSSLNVVGAIPVGDVTRVANVNGEVITVASRDADIGTLATEINTQSSALNEVHSDLDKVIAVSSKLDDITNVNTELSSVTTVGNAIADDASGLNLVVSKMTEVERVSDNLVGGAGTPTIQRVYDSVDNVDTLAGSIVQINKISEVLEGTIETTYDGGLINDNIDTGTTTGDSALTIVANNVEEIVDAADSIVPNIDEILLADDNAVIATRKATEAYVSSRHIEALERTIASRENEAVDVPIKVYTYDEATDTITSVVTEPAEYSALHWQTKTALESASAVNAREMSEKWATESVDVEVETGVYSSLHYSVKSNERASDAERAKADTYSARDRAQIYKTDAEVASAAASDIKVYVEDMKVAIEAIYDSYDDRFLGVYNEHPTEDNDGDELKVGTTYWNEDDQHIWWYNGTEWDTPDEAAAENADRAEDAKRDAGDRSVAAQHRKWETEALKLTVESLRGEDEDTVCNVYTSNEDGTFTVTPTDPELYSVKHHAIKAKASEVASEESKIASEAAMNVSISKSLLAKKYAEEDEDVEIVSGAYSAKHYSLKASASQDVAVTSANSASASKDEAETSATEASNSANTAQLRMWDAEANYMTASSYAMEDEDVEVTKYTSNGDGTFDSTDTGEYSAKHWKIKALDVVAGEINNNTDVDTDGKEDLDILGYDADAEKWIPKTAEELGIHKTNLSFTRTEYDVTIVSSDGDDVIIPTATEEFAGMMARREFDKLSGIEEYAEKNPNATDIKESYEMNANTNAFTDGDKEKLGYISVSNSVDLDNLQTKLDEIGTPMSLMGTWDASDGEFPSDAMKGYTWIVSVDGVVDGVEFNTGDRLLAVEDSASTLNYDDWHKLDYTDKISSVAGKVGVVTLDVEDIGGLVLTNYIAKDADYTASNMDYIMADTTNGAFTITLPASPVIGDTVTVFDVESSFENNNVTVARNGSTIMKLDEDIIMSTNNEKVVFIYSGNDWRIA